MSKMLYAFLLLTMLSLTVAKLTTSNTAAIAKPERYKPEPYFYQYSYLSVATNQYLTLEDAIELQSFIPMKSQDVQIRLQELNNQRYGFNPKELTTAEEKEIEDLYASLEKLSQKQQYCQYKGLDSLEISLRAIQTNTYTERGSTFEALKDFTLLNLDYYLTGVSDEQSPALPCWITTAINELYNQYWTELGESFQQEFADLYYNNQDDVEDPEATETDGDTGDQDTDATASDTDGTASDTDDTATDTDDTATDMDDATDTSKDVKGDPAVDADQQNNGKRFLESTARPTTTAAVQPQSDVNKPDPATSDPATSDPATSDPATSGPATGAPAPTSEPVASMPINPHRYWETQYSKYEASLDSELVNRFWKGVTRKGEATVKIPAENLDANRYYLVGLNVTWAKNDSTIATQQFWGLNTLSSAPITELTDSPFKIDPKDSRVFSEWRKANSAKFIPLEDIEALYANKDITITWDLSGEAYAGAHKIKFVVMRQYNLISYGDTAWHKDDDHTDDNFCRGYGDNYNCPWITNNEKSEGGNNGFAPGEPNPNGVETQDTPSKEDAPPKEAPPEGQAAADATQGKRRFLADQATDVAQGGEGSTGEAGAADGADATGENGGVTASNEPATTDSQDNSVSNPLQNYRGDYNDNAPTNWQEYASIVSSKKVGSFIISFPNLQAGANVFNYGVYIHNEDGTEQRQYGWFFIEGPVSKDQYSYRPMYDKGGPHDEAAAAGPNSNAAAGPNTNGAAGAPSANAPQAPSDNSDGAATGATGGANAGASRVAFTGPCGDNNSCNNQGNCNRRAMTCECNVGFGGLTCNHSQADLEAAQKKQADELAQLKLKKPETAEAKKEFRTELLGLAKSDSLTKEQTDEIKKLVEENLKDIDSLEEADDTLLAIQSLHRNSKQNAETKSSDPDTETAGLLTGFAAQMSKMIPEDQLSVESAQDDFVVKTQRLSSDSRSLQVGGSLNYNGIPVISPTFELPASVKGDSLSMVLMTPSVTEGLMDEFFSPVVSINVIGNGEILEVSGTEDPLNFCIYPFAEGKYEPYYYDEKTGTMKQFGCQLLKDQPTDGSVCFECDHLTMFTLGAPSEPTKDQTPATTDPSPTPSSSSSPVDEEKAIDGNTNYLAMLAVSFTLLVANL